MDDRRAKPGAVAAVALIDPLDHLLAPLVFEIHVDVGWLAPMARDEAFEHHADHVGRDIGDAEGPANDRIGRRSPALTQDAALAGLGHDVMHGQEIGGIAKLADHAQFFRQEVVVAVGNAIGATPGQTRAGQPFQPGLGRFAIGDLVGIFVAEFGQVEAAARRYLQRAADRGGMTVIEPGHVPGAFQPPLGVHQGAGADPVDGEAFAHAGQHIGQRAAGGAVHQHVAHRHHRTGRLLCKPGAGVEPGLIRPVIARRGAQEDMTGIAAHHGPDRSKRPVRVRLRQVRRG